MKEAASKIVLPGRNMPGLQLIPRLNRSLDHIADRILGVASDMPLSPPLVSGDEALVWVAKWSVIYLSAAGLKDWKFDFDNAQRRAGQCNCRKRKITLSEPIVLLNFPNIDAIFDVLLHEIAHALAFYLGGYGHDAIWRYVAIKIGSNGRRCYSDKQVRTPPSAYVYQCPSCKDKVARIRRINHGAACGLCCRDKNRGRYDATYRLILLDSPLQRRLSAAEGSTHAK